MTREDEVHAPLRHLQDARRAPSPLTNGSLSRTAVVRVSPSTLRENNLGASCPRNALVRRPVH